MGGATRAAGAAALMLVLAPACSGGDGGPRRLSRWIVYWNDVPKPSIAAVRPDGTSDHRILNTRQNAKRPRLSPDRRLVAFDGTPPGQPPLTNFDLQLVRFDGTGRRTLTPTLGSWELDAQWSPDGRQLSFTRTPPHPNGCSDSSIWVAGRDGRGTRRLAAGCSARWSPDGERLVFVSPSAHDLLLVDASGGRPRLLLGTDDTVAPAAFSPEGKQVLFTGTISSVGTRGQVSW